MSPDNLFLDKSNCLVDCDDAVKVQSDKGFARRSVNIEDWDGSVTGVPGGAIIGSWAGIWNGGDDCYYDGDWRTWVCPRRPVSALPNPNLVREPKFLARADPDF